MYSFFIRRFSTNGRVSTESMALYSADKDYFITLVTAAQQFAILFVFRNELR